MGRWCGVGRRRRLGKSAPGSVTLPFERTSTLGFFSAASCVEGGESAAIGACMDQNVPSNNGGARAVRDRAAQSQAEGR